MQKAKGWWIPSIGLRMECFRVEETGRICQPIVARTREEAQGILASKLVAWARWIRSNECRVRIADLKKISRTAYVSGDIRKEKKC